jgi:hypothetical protein
MTVVQFIRIGPYRRWVQKLDDETWEPTGEVYRVQQIAMEAIGTDRQVHSKTITCGDTTAATVIDGLWPALERMLEEQMRQDGVWP